MGVIFTHGDQPAAEFGTHEVELHARGAFGNPYLDIDCRVTWERPDGSTVSVDAFYDGANTFKARAYCNAVGTWRWRSTSSLADLDGLSGSFPVADSSVSPSAGKGKLRRHPDDPRQFAYDNGEWFLHIGDTGYRYLSDNEEYWREYVDQAALAGITKIRAWFCLDRSNVRALFQYDRGRLNLRYWQEIDRRLVYALRNHPGLMFQVILLGEDFAEVKRYASGDPASLIALRYAQARIASFANVHWCISNDLRIAEGLPDYAERDDQDAVGREELVAGIEKAGRDLLAREPWGTLITNHQSRFSGYMFLDEPWTDIVTLEDLGQVGGDLILDYRERSTVPVVLDEDRYEYWRPPQHDRYFFRRLMWASLLSGGHATYGGLKTFEPFDGGVAGVQGYFDACRAGKLEQGADDFIHIHRFFRDTRITLVDMLPDDDAAGGNPLLVKVIRSSRKDLYVLYAANPDLWEGHAPDGFAGVYTDEAADAAGEPASVSLVTSALRYSVRWFDPRTGAWHESDSFAGPNISLTTPSGGDWVCVLQAD